MTVFSWRRCFAVSLAGAVTELLWASGLARRSAGGRRAGRGRARSQAGPKSCRAARRRRAVLPPSILMQCRIPASLLCAEFFARRPECARSTRRNECRCRATVTAGAAAGAGAGKGEIASGAEAEKRPFRSGIPTSAL